MRLANTHTHTSTFVVNGILKQKYFAAANCGKSMGRTIANNVDTFLFRFGSRSSERAGRASELDAEKCRFEWQTSKLNGRKKWFKWMCRLKIGKHQIEWANERLKAVKKDAFEGWKVIVSVFGCKTQARQMLFTILKVIERIEHRLIRIVSNRYVSARTKAVGQK